MEKVLKILNDTRPDIDFAKEKLLIDGNVFDSFDIITVVGELNEAFDIFINAADLLPANFNSAEAIWSLVQEHQKKS